MSYQPINLGAVANDGTGDALRAGGDKINDNFVELYNVTSAQAAAIGLNAADIAAMQTAISGLLTGIVTTMSPSNTATQNGAALTQDIINAAGQKIVIPAGDYDFGGGSVGTAAVDISTSEVLGVYLEFLPGARLTCNTSGKNSTNVFFWFREGVVAMIDGGEFDGGAIAEICIRTSNTSNSPGGELTVRNVQRMHNFGWTTADSATASVAGTIGILSNNDKLFVVDNCKFDDFRSKENGTYSDQPGKCTFIQWFNASSGVQNRCIGAIMNCVIDAGAETNEGDDYDLIHLLNQASLAPGQFLIHNCHLKFHGKARRLVKGQGVDLKITKCRMEPTETCTIPAGVTSITVTAATAANPGVFTSGSAHGVPTGTYVKPSAFAGGTWSTINATEYILVPVSSTTWNLFGPGAALNTSGLGTYNASQNVQGTVKRTNDQGPTLLISAATAANPGVFTTRWGLIDNPHGFVTGDMVRFSGLTGGTWSTINDIDYYVVVLSPTTFSLRVPALLDTSGLGTYTGSSGSITRVNGVTEEGMAGIDCAGTPSCLIEIEDCWFNFSGLRNGITQSTGKGATMHVRKSVVIGNRYDSNRLIPDSGSPEVAQPTAWLTNADDINSSIVDCEIYGWARPFFSGGRNNRIQGNRCHDPRWSWLDVNTVVRDGLVVCDNEVITRTPYSLDQSSDAVTADFHRCGTVRNWTNVRINRNRLTRQGNILHGTGFICFIVNGVTGEAEGNVTPDGSGCLPIRYTAGVAPINAGTAAASGNGTTAATATSHKMKGKITTESLTVPAGDTPYVLTVTNDRIAAADIVGAWVANGSNTAGVPMVGRITPAAGSVAIQIFNRHASAAFNGTLIISFLIEKA
jgi:hypothetical protein